MEVALVAVLDLEVALDLDLIKEQGQGTDLGRDKNQVPGPVPGSRVGGGPDDR